MVTDMLLMCKNIPVYDIANKKVINEHFMPGSMLKGMSFESWTVHRKSVLSNTVARRVYFNAFGYGSEGEAERKTHILSLSDCYWIKFDDEDVTFESISPYFTDFWTGTGAYKGGAIPTIYISGAIDKYWLDCNRLYKKGCLVELEAYELAVALHIPCNKIEKSPDETGIIVYNITNSNVMLEPAICTGRFKGTMYPTVEELVTNFGEDGLTMLAFDAVTGNVDRHLENFGYFRDVNTGNYIGMATLYDFDHTLSVTGTDDYLITQLPYNEPMQISIIENICKKVLSVTKQPVFIERANAILNRITDLEKDS